ncbi:phosphatidylethanolamine-binding protein [Mycena capillaripes]|nr:phosphatidylethanolamine-binding protein [Mycena capillaripes]
MAIFTSPRNSFVLPLFLVCALARPWSEIRAVTDSSLANVSTAFSNAGIVPGVIPVFKPTGILDVVFTVPTTQQTLNATPGTNLTVQQTADEPKFILTSDDATAANAEYVVALFDPDAPTPQNTTFAQFRHLLGAGYRWSPSNGSDTGVLTNTTAAITEFVPPGPPALSDPHRYMVLVYVQSADFASKVPSILNSSTPRTNFNMTAFSDALGLGSPIAGIFFFTGPDTTTTPSQSGPGSSSTGKPSAATSLQSRLVVTGAFASILIAYLLK